MSSDETWKAIELPPDWLHPHEDGWIWRSYRESLRQNVSEREIHMATLQQMPDWHPGRVSVKHNLAYEQRQLDPRHEHQADITRLLGSDYYPVVLGMRQPQPVPEPPAWWSEMKPVSTGYPRVSLSSLPSPPSADEEQRDLPHDAATDKRGAVSKLVDYAHGAVHLVKGAIMLAKVQRMVRAEDERARQKLKGR